MIWRNLTWSSFSCIDWWCDDADKSSRMNYGMYGAILRVYIHPNALKPTGWRLITWRQTITWSLNSKRFIIPDWATDSPLSSITAPTPEKKNPRVRLITLRNKGEVQRMLVDFNSECCNVHRSPSDILYSSEQNAGYLCKIITAAWLRKSLFAGSDRRRLCRNAEEDCDLFRAESSLTWIKLISQISSSDLLILHTVFL